MNYINRFKKIKEKCVKGGRDDVRDVLALLNGEVDLPTTRAIDYYLGLVSNSDGIQQMENFLMTGTQIQRNYCTLFFARRNEWDIVNKAYSLGLIDEIQAYSR